MKKDFKSRLMPNIKFKINGDISKCSDVFDIKMLEYGLFHAITDINGSKIFHIPNISFDSCIYKEVSIYEAIPELIPDGMRYNKELDKLVPDVITDFKSKKSSMTDWAKENINPNIVAFDDVEINKDEHPSKIKVESKKIVDITPEDKEILTALRQCGKSYLQIINLIKNTDTFTPSYYGAKCKCGEKLDAYAICDKYSNEHKPSAWHHAVKKLIRAGDGHKPLLKDINEVIDSLKRWKEQLNAK